MFHLHSASTLAFVCAVAIPLLAVPTPAQTSSEHGLSPPLSYTFPTTGGTQRFDTTATTIDVPKFDPTIGRLVSVSVRHSSNVQARCSVMQTVPTSTMRAELRISMAYSLTMPGASDLAASQMVADSPFVPPGPPTLVTLPTPTLHSLTTTITGAAALAYVGSGSTTFDLSMSFDQLVFAPRPMTWNYSIQTRTTVFVTYDYASWWTDEGNALAGASGTPQLNGYGAFGGGMPSALLLHGANPNAPAALLFGTSRLDLPLFGGVLVPNPLASVPLMTRPTGSYALGFVSAFGPDVTMYFQIWIADPGAPAGLAASNAVSATS